MNTNLYEPDPIAAMRTTRLPVDRVRPIAAHTSAHPLGWALRIPTRVARWLGDRDLNPD